MTDSLSSTGSGEDLVCLGAFAGAHGLGGLVRVRPFTGEPKAVGDYGPVRNEAGTTTYDMKVVRVGPKDQVIVRVDGVDDREAAEALKGVRFCVDRSRLPAPEDDEFYHADLIGLAAVDTAGQPVGRVRAVLDYGAGDMLDIVGGEVEVVVPFTRAAVPEIDLANGRVVVDPPAGLTP